MKTIYIDSDFRCHMKNDGAMTEVNTSVFDEKCDAYIEGYRFVPAGKRWIRDDGASFDGEMVAPFVDYTTLAAYQQQYETMQRELISAYQEGVNSV